VEALIALLILSLAATSGYAVLRTVVKRYQNLRSTALVDRRVAMASVLLARDLRSAYVGVNERRTMFVGHSHDGEPGTRIDFTKMSASGGGQPAEVGYSFKRLADGEWQLWRRSQEPADADPLSGGQESLVCGAIKRFDATFLDGEAWSTSWGWDAERQRPFEGIRGLPVAVSIHLTLGTAKKEHTARFVVPVMVALLNRGPHV
jgi:type II secretory pathway component PulJ